MARPFLLLLWPQPSEGAERPYIPRYPYTVAEGSPVGFDVVSRSTRHPPSKPSPGPAGPRPDTQSGPRGRAGAQLGGGGKDAADAHRGGP